MKLSSRGNFHFSSHFQCDIPWSIVVKSNTNPLCVLHMEMSHNNTLSIHNICIGKMFHDSIIGKWKGIRNKCPLFHGLYVIHEVEAFITLDWNSWSKYVGPFYILLLVCKLFLLFVDFMYIKGFFNNHPHTLFRFPPKTPPLGRPCAYKWVEIQHNCRMNTTCTSDILEPCIYTKIPPLMWWTPPLYTQKYK